MKTAKKITPHPAAPVARVKPVAEPMVNVMVDLETLGNRPGCKILSIGAVAFGPTGLGGEHYSVVDRFSQDEFGLHEDSSTLEWWMKQSPEARQVLADAVSDKALPIESALYDFNLWLANFDKSNVKLWGNGSDFDNAILISCLAATKQEAGWKFWNNRCYRTLKSLNPYVKLERTGTYHNALDDAKTQALHAIQMLWPHRSST